MRTQFPALRAELIKIKRSSIVWVTFLAFALAPLMGGVFLLILRDPEASTRADALSNKVRMMQFSADWKSYLGLLTQTVGYGTYFPWSIPGLYSGASGTAVQLGSTSYLLLGLTSLIGYACTVFYWKYADQSK